MSIAQFAAANRKAFTWMFAGGCLALALFTAHGWSSQGWLDAVIESVGLVLIVVGSYGRIWSTLYICGRKNIELVRVGPYALVRNPLYISSLIAAIGIGLASENLAVLALLLIGFVGYYPLVVRAEEDNLRRVHGAAFDHYAAEVPRFLPRFARPVEPDEYTVSPRTFRRVLLDSMWFFWLYVALETAERLRQTGVLPTVWTLP